MKIMLKHHYCSLVDRETKANRQNVTTAPAWIIGLTTRVSVGLTTWPKSQLLDINSSSPGWSLHTNESKSPQCRRNGLTTHSNPWWVKSWAKAHNLHPPSGILEMAPTKFPQCSTYSCTAISYVLVGHYDNWYL